MQSCMTILVAAALLLAVDEPKPGTKDAPPPGWSIATEGSGIPGVRTRANMPPGSIARSLMAARLPCRCGRSSRSRLSFRSVTQFVKADAYRGKRVRVAGYLKTRDVADWCGLWLRVDGPDRMLGFDNMQSRPSRALTTGLGMRRSSMCRMRR